MKKLIKLLVFIPVLMVFLPFVHADASSKNEVWAYLMQHEIRKFKGTEPITDLFLFSSQIDYKGNLYGLSKKPSLPSGAKKMRVHLVVALFGNSTLMNLIFTPGSSYQNKLIADIVKFSSDYDGVQVDFESIPAEMCDNYTLFLKKLRENLPKKKLFTVALQAKRSSVRNAFDYASIGKIADKVLIMAYDQHWSTSEPGPVAGIDWCEEIVDYAVMEIDPSKIIMGIPFYGRSWESVNNTKAVRYSSISEILEKNNVLHNGHDEETPNIKFSTSVDVTVYFETNNSIMKKIDMYRRKNVRGVGFWRLSMESDNFWDIFRKDYLR